MCDRQLTVLTRYSRLRAQRLLMAERYHSHSVGGSVTFSVVFLCLSIFSGENTPLHHWYVSASKLSDIAALTLSDALDYGWRWLA